MEFSDNSRVWIYQANRELTDAETTAIQQRLVAFAKQWTAHNNQLHAGAEVRYNRFLILIVDEEHAGASGCSIDKSVHFMQHIEQDFNIDLFDRFNLAYRTVEGIKSANRDEFEALIKRGVINDDTIVFNNLARNVEELNNKWEVPFSQSWHARVFAN